MTSESTPNDNPIQEQSNADKAELPSFQGQLCHTAPQKFGGSDDWFGILPSPRQRLLHFLASFTTKFLLALAVLAAIVLVASLILTFMNEMRLYVSLKTRKIVLGRELSESYAREALAFDDIKEFKIEPPSSVFKRSRLIALSGDSGYLIAETFGDSDDLIALRDWLNEAISNN